MRSPAERRIRALAVIVTAIGVFAIPSAAAAEVTQSDLVLIRSEDVVAEDLFAAGNTIQISGQIQGDLVASALGELRIDGTVDGSVTAAASRVVIAGVVRGSVRVLASEVVIEGTVEGDLATVARRTTVDRTGSIGRDVLLSTWSTSVSGEVGRNVDGFARTLIIAGTVNQNVDVDVNRLVVEETAGVGGDLGYRSGRPGEIAAGASIQGSVLDRRPLPPNVRVTGLGLLIRVLIAVFGAGLGLAVLWSAEGRAVMAGKALRARPLVSVGQGVAVVAIPILLVAGVVVALSYMAPESAFPLLAVALPFLLAVTGVFGLVAFITPLPPALAIGSRIAARRSPHAQFLVGFLVLVVLAVVPVIGRWVFVAVLISGIGAWITRLGTPPDADV